MGFKDTPKKTELELSFSMEIKFYEVSFSVLQDYIRDIC